MLNHALFGSSLCIAIASLALAAPSALSAKNTPAKAAERKSATILQPTSPWQLEMGDHICRLARKFGPDNAPGMVSFVQNAPGPRFDLTVAAPDFASLSTQAWTFYGLRSDRTMQQFNDFQASTRDFGPSIIMVGMSIADKSTDEDYTKARIEPDDANLVERIVILNAGTTVSFETGNMKAPLEALNACSQDLMESWGLSSEAHDGYEPPRMPNANLYLSRLKHTFAEESGSDGHRALVRFRALVGKDGRVTDCHFEYALKTGGQETDLCADIAKMQFEAASNSAGEPITSFYARSALLWPYSPWNVGADGGRWGSD